MPVDIEQLKGLSIEGAALSYVVSASDSCRVIVLSHLRLSPPCMLSGSILAGVVAAALWHHGELWYWNVAVVFSLVALLADAMTVQSESLMIVPKVGLVYTAHRALDVLRSSTFVSSSHLQHVFLNEVTTKHRHVFYLTLALCSSDSPDTSVSRLLPLFTHTAPRLEMLQNILADIHSCLALEFSAIVTEGVG